MDGKRYVIVRGNASGVHAGWMKEHDGSCVTLMTTRRLWRWHGRTLSGLALEGTTDDSYCKYSPEIPEITILDACEIIPCTEAGRLSIQNMEDWENE